MVRRTPRQQAIDDLAFPVRVKFAVPMLGLGRTLDAVDRWLAEELGPGEFACHSSPSIGCDAAAIYFRTISSAERFTYAFPDLMLADGTRAPAYGSPSQSAASRTTTELKP
jgi:hypothetical protein